MGTIILALARLSAVAGITAATAPATLPGTSHKVIEFRQYKLKPGAQQHFIALFDREFVDTQEAVGMRLIGHFHDHDRADRFTWIREFPDMTARARMLDTFYNGPVWRAHRDEANPMLDDNDDVLLLREARQGSGFGSASGRPAIGAKADSPSTYFAVIEYLWKDPGEGFSDFFLDDVAPQLRRAGLSPLGIYVPEEQPNNFPRLPIRPDRKILVWFTKADQPEEFGKRLAAMKASSEWKKSVGPRYTDAEERQPQILRLDPAPRSALR